MIDNVAPRGRPGFLERAESAARSTRDARIVNRATPLLAWLASASCSFLAGCAAISGEGHLLTEDARLAANVRSCCRDQAEVLAHRAAHAPADQATLVWFAATTPHFDFGNGLAPFAVIHLKDPLSPVRVELESLMRLRGWTHGGDGKAHYADAVALFFDGAGRPIATPAGERVQRATQAGVGALLQTFPVPAGAASLVVTSNPKSNGLGDASGALNAPGGVPGSGVLILPGSVFPLGYRLATYGPVQVRWVR